MSDLIKHINAIRNIPVQEDAIKYKLICELIDREGSQFEGKTGKWIDSIEHDGWFCSKCGYQITSRYGKYNYCPNCGSRMGE